MKDAQMKAIVWTKYGPPDVLQLKEVAKPTPKNSEVLIKVCASTVTAGDCEVRSMKIPILLRLPMRAYIGLRKPKRITTLGLELAGEIETVGKDVKRFKKDDQVFAATEMTLGANAEYIVLPEQGALITKPANMSYEEAAAVPNGGLEALYFLRKGNVQSGQKVLINGAGGSIGTFGVQLAKYYGAEVTGVDSAEKLDMLSSIGADHVIDYTQEDFTRNGQTYDVIFDVVGKSPFSRSKRSLNKKGFYLLANPGVTQMFLGLWTTITSSKKVVFPATNQSPEEKTKDLVFLKELIEAGKIKSVIGRCYPLEETAEAHKYVESGHKKGNVVISMKPNNKT